MFVLFVTIVIITLPFLLLLSISPLLFRIYREVALNDAEILYGEREMKIVNDFQNEIESLKTKYETWIAQEIHRATDATSRLEEEQAAHGEALAKYET